MKRYLAITMLASVAIAIPVPALAIVCDENGTLPSPSPLGDHEIWFRSGRTSGGDMAALGAGDSAWLGYWPVSAGSGSSNVLGICIERTSGTRSFYYAYDRTNPSVAFTQQTDHSYVRFGNTANQVYVVLPNNDLSHQYDWYFNCFPSTGPRSTAGPNTSTLPWLAPWRYNGYRLYVAMGGGDDEFSGGAGDDHVCGGDGLDYLLGSSGNDALDGWRYSDFVNGGLGDDDLYGYSGQDIVFDDYPLTIVPGAHDSLFGESGSDCIEDHYGHSYFSCGPDDDGYFHELGYTHAPDCETLVPEEPFFCAWWSQNGNP